MTKSLNSKDKKFIKYFKYLKKAKDIIQHENLNKKNILRVNNLYKKADSLFLQINRQKSYSTTGIVLASAAGVALSGGFLYYFGKKFFEDQNSIIDLNKLDFKEIKNYSLDDLVDIWSEKYGDENYNDTRLNIEEVYNYLNNKLNLQLKRNEYESKFIDQWPLINYIDQFYIKKNKFTENDLDSLVSIIKTDNVVDLKKVSTNNFIDKLIYIKQKDNLRKIIIEKL